MKQFAKRFLFLCALVIGIAALFTAGFSTANGFEGSTARAIDSLTVAVVGLLFLKAARLL